MELRNDRDVHEGSPMAKRVCTDAPCASPCASPSLLSAAERAERATALSRWQPNVRSDSTFAFDKKWEHVYAEDEQVPKFGKKELTIAIGTLMRRLDHCETQRREDRARVTELEAENMEMRRRIGELNRAMKAAGDTALYCKEAPPFDPSPTWAPREMSIPEKQWLQEALEGLRDNDPRIIEVQRILMLAANDDGKVVIDLKFVTPCRLWQLYYYIRHRVIYRRATVTQRTARTLESIKQGAAIEVSESALKAWGAYSEDEGEQDEGEQDEDEEDEEQFGYGTGAS